ncbi:MAG TPA: hypothetical protein PKD60_02200 [Turneriella sp.]|nr:hypothetical protein [Turneriella sp.]
MNSSHCQANFGAALAVTQCKNAPTSLCAGFLAQACKSKTYLRAKYHNIIAALAQRMHVFWWRYRKRLCPAFNIKCRFVEQQHLLEIKVADLAEGIVTYPCPDPGIAARLSSSPMTLTVAELVSRFGIDALNIIDNYSHYLFTEPGCALSFYLFYSFLL